MFLEAHRRPQKEIVLELDATDGPVHGDQEKRFFHAYYGGYFYLPLYVFCGRHLLAAKFRRANIDASAGAVDKVARIVAAVRARWPYVRILLRAEPGFAREPLMVGARRTTSTTSNERLAVELVQAEAESSKAPAGRFKDFRYATLRTWSRRRRVVGRAE